MSDDTGLERELTELEEGDVPAIAALRLVRDRLSLGLDEGFERLRRHPSWSHLVLRHGLDERPEEGVVQVVVDDGLVVFKEYRHDRSAFDPPDQDDYRFFEYEFELEGRVYDGRRYLGEDNATIGRALRRMPRGDATRIARFLIDRDGVRRVDRFSIAFGIYNRIVAIGPGWSDLDPLILLALRDGPLSQRALRSKLKELDAVAPRRRELGGSLRRLRAAHLLGGDDAFALTPEAERLLAETSASDGTVWEAYMRLDSALRQRPLPDLG